MTSITKPPVRHPGLRKNTLGFTVRDYEDRRGALHRDGRGRSDRGDLAALRKREAGGE